MLCCGALHDCTTCTHRAYWTITNDTGRPVAIQQFTNAPLHGWQSQLFLFFFPEGRAQHEVITTKGSGAMPIDISRCPGYEATDTDASWCAEVMGEGSVNDHKSLRDHGRGVFTLAPSVLHAGLPRRATCENTTPPADLWNT